MTTSCCPITLASASEPLNTLAHGTPLHQAPSAPDGLPTSRPRCLTTTQSVTRALCTCMIRWHASTLHGRRRSATSARRALLSLTTCGVPASGEPAEQGVAISDTGGCLFDSPVRSSALRSQISLSQSSCTAPGLHPLRCFNTPGGSLCMQICVHCAVP